MTLITTVTKKSVSKLMDQLWNITMNMTLTDETVEVINKDYSIRFISGDDISKKTNQLKIQMQTDIDIYKAGQVIYKDAALNTAVSTVEKGLVI